MRTRVIPHEPVQRALDARTSARRLLGCSCARIHAPHRRTARGGADFIVGRIEAAPSMSAAASASARAVAAIGADASAACCSAASPRHRARGTARRATPPSLPTRARPTRRTAAFEETKTPRPRHASHASSRYCKDGWFFFIENPRECARRRRTARSRLSRVSRHAYRKGYARISTNEKSSFLHRRHARERAL